MVTALNNRLDKIDDSYKKAVGLGIAGYTTDAFDIGPDGWYSGNAMTMSRIPSDIDKSISSTILVKVLYSGPTEYPTTIYLLFNLNTNALYVSNYCSGQYGGIASWKKLTP